MDRESTSFAWTQQVDALKPTRMIETGCCKSAVQLLDVAPWEAEPDSDKLSPPYLASNR